jgi:heparan-alpha-glucosaminide N-acetyltransferase
MSFLKPGVHLLNESVKMKMKYSTVLEPTAEYGARFKPNPIYKKLTADRILSIDLFRGITILIMVFVNELEEMRNIPAWMQHQLKDANAMSFVDVVFPAFLFIAGMSIPFALNNRLSKGDNIFTIQKHILWRTIGLLTLGFFMVNAEPGNFFLMPFNIHLWSVLFFIAAILIWNVYTIKNATWISLLKGIGVGGLIFLAFIYRGGDDGTEYINPHWWGILGLIGWSYLFNCLFYQLFGGKIAGMTLLIIICTGLFVLTMKYYWEDDAPAKNATHVAIMACGVISSLILFDEAKTESLKQRFSKILFFALLLFAVGYFLQPYYKISKIDATPSWGLYSAAICCVLYSLFYWIVDIRGWKRWTSFFNPAASNPLLIYIIPAIIFHIISYFQFSFIPDRWRGGLPAIIWSACYAIIMMWIAAGLNKMKVKLRL